MNNRNLMDLEDEARRIENEIANKGQCYFMSPNHNLEIYLAEYYTGREYTLLEDPIHRIYYEIAIIYEQEGNFSKMWQALKKAYSYNPADMEIQFMMVRQYYRENDLKKMHENIQTLYPYVYTARDMSEYYVMLGCYYLTGFQPEVAEVLYMYGKLFGKSGQAEQDLMYIDKAVGRTKKDWNYDKLRNFLEQNDIPVQPDVRTLGFVYKIALKSVQSGKTEYALQLFKALYQLTQDEEIANYISMLE